MALVQENYIISYELYGSLKTGSLNTTLKATNQNSTSRMKKVTISLNSFKGTIGLIWEFELWQHTSYGPVLLY